MSDLRWQQLTHWLREIYDDSTLEIKVVSADASFRRYFRFQYHSESLIAVDAPPDKEDCAKFRDISAAFLLQGVNVPTVLHIDIERGFMVLNDFGDQLFMPVAQQLPQTFNRLIDAQNSASSKDTFDECVSVYRKVLMPLLNIMQVKETEQGPLASYNAEKLSTEMQLMEEWFFPEYLEYNLNAQEKELLERTIQQLLNLALTQPQVGVHRDYHSRNLMLLPNGDVGVIDFQDAVVGPLTYDLVSLLRDCYLVLPDDIVIALVEHFYQMCISEHFLDEGTSIDLFMQWFDWMGLQRHIKVLGIFARLSFRDGKHGYLNDIPRVFDYVLSVAGKYRELMEFHQWMLNTVKPLLLKRANDE